MTTRKPKNPILDQLREAAHDERLAVEFIEARRWGTSPACPRCGSVEVYQMRDRKTGGRNKDHRWRCRDCTKAQMFTVRTGTVLEETRLPLRTWCHALWRAAASKKGVSALQISRECEISYKSALFLMHRIRHAMGPGPGPARLLKGTVEMDETFIGGKPRVKGKGVREKWSSKIPVVGMVERGGDARLRVMDRITTANLAGAVIEHIDPSARFMTDELRAYVKVGRRFKGGHGRIRHRANEYARGDVTTNTIEGAFGILKRAVYGTFHSVSRKHLPKYLNEFEFRYNTRQLDDGARAEALVKAAEGKRLTYREPPAA